MNRISKQISEFVIKKRVDNITKGAWNREQEQILDYGKKPPKSKDLKNLGNIEKYKEYWQQGKEYPKDTQWKRGPRGKYFYETSGRAGGAGRGKVQSAVNRMTQTPEDRAKAGKQKEFRQYGITARKYMGDDQGSWAVFRNNRPIVTGLTQREVSYHKNNILENIKGKKAKEETVLGSKKIDLGNK